MLSRSHLKLLLKPIVKAFIRHTHSIHEFISLAKVVFVEVATEELARIDEEVNISRISVMTGLNRRDVTSVVRSGDKPLYEGASVLGRVISKWESDKRFCKRPGVPRELMYEGDNSEFYKLVRSISEDTNPATMLFEMLRSKIAEQSGDKLKLVKREAVIPGDLDRGFKFVSRDIDLYLNSVEENILTNPPVRNLHLRTEYDNIDPEKLAEVKKWLLEFGQEFHKKAREYLTQYDRGDLQDPFTQTEESVRVSLSTFGIAFEQNKMRNNAKISND